ncbi:hypothetical protein [Mycobacterium neumannii]|uniref:hypothetical protein n=1 Tax=Mycobacterium neumannii TaxID=2048551 RepID=UPI003AB23CE2
MGVRQAVARLAVSRVHVLTVEVPGHWTTRCALQRQMVDRGWRDALSAADADVLAVCGSPGPELAGLVDRIWDQLPGPRVRVEVIGPPSVSSGLDRAAVGLLDDDRQRADARSRPQRPDIVNDENHGEDDHADMDQGDMDHGPMDMAPEGIPLARGSEDRDGLKMDSLHLRLGPVLPYWPPALVIRCSINGDVITDARAGLVDAERHGNPSEPASLGGSVLAARECDHIHNLLALAGWPRGAGIARRSRDLLLSDDHANAVRLLHGLQHSVRRSMLLRWSLRGVGTLTREELDARALPAALEGDAYTGLLQRLDVAGDLASHASTANPLRVDTQAGLDALPHLVGGLDIATARLAVAALGMETSLYAKARTP